MTALYGFVDLPDLFNSRVSEVGASVVDAAIQRTMDEYNRQIEALTGLFCRRTTDYTARFKTPGIGRSQPLDDNGRALPIKAIGYHDVAWPIQGAGASWGANFKTREKMTVGDVNNTLATILGSDATWVRDHILSAAFNHLPWTFNDEEKGALIIQGLANGDSALYQQITGSMAPAPDNHYYAQPLPISDAADPFPIIEAELSEHPENGGRPIALIPTNLKSSVMALSEFVQAPLTEVQLGSGERYLTAALGIAVPGTVMGFHNSGVWLVEWKSLPNDYIVAVTPEGERPLSMREEPEASLQGFVTLKDREDTPFTEYQWVRWAGFGGWNRVGALVYRINASAYAIPAGYTAPIP